MRTLATEAEGTHIAGADGARVHLAGEAQHVHVVIDANLLLARDHQMTVGQHSGDDSGDGAAEVIGVLVAALALVGVVAAGGGGGTAKAVGRNARQGGDAGRQAAGLDSSLVLVWVADTFSTMLTVSVSPTRRAR